MIKTEEEKRKSGRWDLNPRPQRPERCALARLRYSPKAFNYKLTFPICPALSWKKNGGDWEISPQKIPELRDPDC